MAFIDISTLDPAKTIVVSTGNAHKVIEIEEILGKVLPEVRFVALGELGDFPDAVEDGVGGALLPQPLNIVKTKNNNATFFIRRPPFL